MARFADLLDYEVSDVFLTAQKISRVLETHLNAQAMTFAVQDGRVV